MKAPRTPKVNPTADLFPALPGQPAVVNIRGLLPGWEQIPTHVYIGRPRPGLSGLWGNPIKPGRFCVVCDTVHKTPADTIPCYRTFLAQLRDGSPAEAQVLRGNLLMLTGRVLCCFCAPRPCHGHDIVREWRRIVLDHPNDADVRTALAPYTS